jgi:ribosomal protein S18 acetylase RimI-like enzyme
MTSDKRYEIALGTVADIGDIVRFQVAMALESEGTVLNTERVTAGVTAAINDPNRGFYIVAKLDGNTVGSLMVTKEWSDWNNQWYWWVQSVYVTPEHRKSGVFRALYESVKERAAANSVSQIRLYVDKENISAQSVYRSTGLDECHYIMYEEHIPKR